mmetsp:Transcript_15546/g.31451  ORF Transcript_15546/g.31451 Transcript_15546/m.31451 type:complete len:718 (-) Transcript_15546:2010-4163(-)|eukprot:CAMPEP_0184681434 /NCGR_PEP_ID=MMETSP0312-20130426/4413_1 /TAXON_ID=31354 /ORGANISM="Compsopogon coeruleus, Strain SAG 36.94" /LENGTH=717 /DNA_ID=CAMNT_0027132279 /DNA_START=486 /DNA_END=2639 /DNA_ORIENTATION=-
MSSYVGRLLSAVSSSLEFNAATLTGAMDVIVLQEEDGTLRCTPFHARFGKLKLFKSREKLVEVWVNGRKSELTMRLGRAGEAYFTEEIDDALDTDYTIASPPTESDNEDGLVNEDRDSMILSDAEEPDVVGNAISSDETIVSKQKEKAERMVPLASAGTQTFSDRAYDLPDPPESALEFSELVISQVDTDDVERPLLSMSLCRHLLNSSTGTIDAMDIFDSHRVSYAQFSRNPEMLDSGEIVIQLRNRLLTWEKAAPEIASMLCFGAPLFRDLADQIGENPNISTSIYEDCIESKPNSSTNDPGYKFNPDPLTLTGTVELSPVEQIALANLRSLTDAIPKELAGIGLDQICDKVSPEEMSHERAVVDLLRAGAQVEPKGEKQQIPGGFKRSKGSFIDRAALKRLPSLGQLDGPIIRSLGSDSSPSTPLTPDAMRRFATASTVDSDGFERLVRKSLRPTSDQILALGLSPGINTVTFVVVHNQQKVSSRIFLWPSDAKIVVSDVDGTITRSDILGHLLPRVGRDWSQAGVAGLYSKIASNGYRVMYLTSRPIGQAGATRLYIESLRQGDGFKLPEGPVVMSPDRMMKSLTREMIQRRPHEFKIAALQEIRDMFPTHYNPFYAGFGNRITDAISYQSVNIPVERIFTVNAKGELQVMNALYEASGTYSNLRVLVESVFPDLTNVRGRERVDGVTNSAIFNSRNFWRPSLPRIDITDIIL